MTNSISTKLFLVLLLCSTVILGLGMALDYRLSSDAIMQRMHLEADETIDSTIANLDNLLGGVEGATLFFAKILQQREYSQPGLKQMLGDAVRENSDVFGAAIALNPAQSDNPTGYSPYYFHREGQLNYLDLAKSEQPYWEQDWYTEAAESGGPIWTRPYYDELGGETWMTTFSVPVYRSDAAGNGVLYAVVTADITLQELDQYLQHLPLGDSGFGILLSKAGTVLSTRDSGNPLRDFRQMMGDTSGRDDWDAIMTILRQGEDLTRDIECPDSEQACSVRLGALRSTGWPVGIIYSETEVLAPLREFQIKTALISLVTIGVLALALWLVTSRLTRPLTFLARASAGIAQGRMDMPLPRASGNDEVARLVLAFKAMQINLKSYIADLETATANRSRLEGELAAARDIQMSMLPQGGEALETTGEYALWARVCPAKTVGGDLYTYYRLDNLLFIAVGDVSDKGVPASLFMARAISLIQQLTARGREPSQAMAVLNDALEEGNDSCMFVTLFLGLLNLDTLQLHFSSAGHTPPSLVRNGEVQVGEQDDGPALGLARDLHYPGNVLQLAPGDRLAIYTDGIDEAFNEQAQMFGVARFHEILLGTINEKVDAAGQDIFSAIEQFAGKTPQSDDITLMLLQIPGQPPGQGSVESFSNGPRLSGRVLDWLEMQLESMPTTDAVKLELTLVIEEVVTNIDKYALLPPEAVVEFSLLMDNTGITVQASDPGIAFNPLEQAKGSSLGSDIETAEIGGLGVHLIRHFTDQQEYSRVDGRNILRVIRHLPTEPD